MKSTTVFALGMSSFLLAACSQPPAPVAIKGDQFYGKDRVSAFAQNGASHGDVAAGFTPVFETPVQSAPAPLESISVSELSAPVPQAMPEPSRAFQPVIASTAPISQPQLQTSSPVLANPAPALEPLPIDTFAAVATENPVQAAIKAERKQEPASQASSTFIWPVEGEIVSRFGPKQNGLVNDGINIAAREGEPIWAAASGEVVYSGNELKGYGNMMIIRHANGWMTAYAHTSDRLVKKGDTVQQGDLIGYVGKTGAVTSAQLHFGIREGKTPVNPETLLPRRVASAR